MTGALLVGLLAGVGVLLVATGLAPAPPPLQRELSNLQRRPVHTPLAGAQRSSSVVAAGGRLEATAVGQRLTLPLGADLRITNSTPAEHLGQRALATAAGGMAPPVLAALLWLLGTDLNLAFPLWLSAATGSLGFVYPAMRLRSNAAERRRSFRHALSAFLDVVAISLAGGRGVDTALRDGATAGHEWPFEMLQSALLDARLNGEPPWVGLGRLGNDMTIPELEELAASAALAGDEGARVRASLTAKARALRLRGLTDVEAAANSASETMSLPVVLLMAGFVIFLGFPAVIRVLQGI